VLNILKKTILRDEGGPVTGQGYWGIVTNKNWRELCKIPELTAHIKWSDWDLSLERIKKR
jgi:hypothetical protein